MYLDVGNDGAIVTHTLTDTSYDINKTEWDAKRYGMVCTSMDDFGYMKSTIEKLCSEHRALCRVEEQAKMLAVFERIEKARKRR